MRGSADGDPKGKVPCGMTWVWMPVKAGPFSSRGTCSSMAFNHDWLVDPRGDPVGRNRSACCSTYKYRQYSPYNLQGSYH